MNIKLIEYGFHSGFEAEAFYTILRVHGIPFIKYTMEEMENFSIYNPESYEDIIWAPKNEVLPAIALNVYTVNISEQGIWDILENYEQQYKNEQTQKELVKQIHDAGINVVNCGDCGYTQFHATTNPPETLICPNCNFEGKLCDFPDYDY